MYDVIYTKSRDNADEIVAKTWSFEKHEDACVLFKEHVKRLYDEALDNQFLNFKLSLHNYRAMVKIEGTHYVVALVKDKGILEDDNANRQ